MPIIGLSLYLSVKCFLQTSKNFSVYGDAGGYACFSVRTLFGVVCVTSGQSDVNGYALFSILCGPVVLVSSGLHLVGFFVGTHVIISIDGFNLLLDNVVFSHVCWYASDPRD